MLTKVYGIDQTGAVLGKNKAKPLKACELILGPNLKIEDVVFFKIPELGQWTHKLDSKATNHVFIDCVLGLPIKLYISNPEKSLRDWILKTKHFQIEKQSYGRKVSEAFFNSMLDYYNLNPSSPPKRAIEVSLKSNSVFTTRPFQKNIQTGTFRIWKELSQVLQGITLWPSDFYLKDEANTIFYEVYPSYFYKILLSANTRHPDPVIKYLSSKITEVNKVISESILDPDKCDALVAALGGLHCLKTRNLWDFNDENIFFEGNILGL